MADLLSCRKPTISSNTSAWVCVQSHRFLEILYQLIYLNGDGLKRVLYAYTCSLLYEFVNIQLE